MNLLFLGCDGVVNRNIWFFENGKWICRKGTAEDGTITDLQSVQWISAFCEKENFGIVLLGTWQRYTDPEKTLRQAGLRDTVKIIGRIDFEHPGPEQIDTFIKAYGDEAEDYMIVMSRHEWSRPLKIHDLNITGEIAYGKGSRFGVRLLICDDNIGFGECEYNRAEENRLRLAYIRQACIGDIENETRPLLMRAVDLLFEAGTLTTSLLQRKLTIGYRRATEIIDYFERSNIISRTANGVIVPNMHYNKAIKLVSTCAE